MGLHHGHPHPQAPHVQPPPHHPLSPSHRLPMASGGVGAAPHPSVFTPQIISRINRSTDTPSGGESVDSNDAKVDPIDLVLGSRKQQLSPQPSKF